MSTKTKKRSRVAVPVMLGTLEDGSQFIHDGVLWEVLQQNPGEERPVNEGKARCRKVNTPVIISICRSNYVVRV